MDRCAATSAFISSVISQIDCQAEILGSRSWAALAAPGSTVSHVVTGLMTILTALLGYNLMLGRALTVRSGTLTLVKLGAVLALTTNWSAYNTLVYNLVTEAPAELLAEIGPAAGVLGSEGKLIEQLDVTDQALAQVAILSAKIPVLPPDAQTVPQPFGGFDALALGASRVLFELTAVAAIGGVRVISALMLALGPLFVAFLMFNTTSSIVSGWIRLLVGTTVAAVGVSLVLGLELTFLGPWLRRVLAVLGSGTPVPTAASELLVLTSFFTLTTVGALWASTRIGVAFRMPSITEWAWIRSRLQNREAATHKAETYASPAGLTDQRAATIARAIIAPSRRDRASSVLREFVSSKPEQVPWLFTDDGCRAAPTGRQFARTSKSRLSARAAKRDAVA